MARRVDPGELRELAEWRPPLGVVSVCASIDPADRRESWRAQLRDRLKELVEASRDRDRELWVAMKATAERILGGFPEDRPHRAGRTRLGYVEVGEGDGGRDRWYSFQLPVRGTQAVHWERPNLRPLVELLDDGAPLGVLAVGSERVRLWEWSLGETEELAEWEPEFRKRDWRERRAPQSADPARSQGVSAAGKDQIGQRLDANRERFLREAGERLAEPLRSRGWRTILAFGQKDQVETLASALEGRAAGLESQQPIRLIAEKDLVGEREGQIAERVGEVLDELNRERELKLVRRAEDAAYAQARAASLGRQETMQALAEGRVAHLLFDAGADFDGAAPSWTGASEGAGSGPGDAVMIDQALLTGAWITPVEGKAAEALASHEGVAALLRY